MFLSVASGPMSRDFVGPRCRVARARGRCEPRSVRMPKQRTKRVELANVIRELPRRAHDLSRREVRDSQRWRLLEAVTEVVAVRGYGEATVEHVIKSANVSRKTFYEYFRDKDECFFAAYDHLSKRLLSSLERLGQRYPSGPQRRKAQIEAYLDALASEPLVARVFLVDIFAAGTLARERRDRVTASCGETILGAGINPTLRTAIVGGVNSVVATALVNGPAGRLRGLAGELTLFVEDAMRSSATSRRGKRR